MIGYVTIDIHGGDMGSASRHAQRLANNFLDDLDTMQRASRARDRRAMSHLETGVEEPFPRVIHTSVSRRTPLYSTRLRSVPPAPSVSTTYRPIFYTSDIGVTPLAPRTYYRTQRYVSETPYYLSSYSTRTSETSRPPLSSVYTSTSTPVTHRYTYYQPSTVARKLYTPYRVGSYTNLSPEVQHERRRIEVSLEDHEEQDKPSRQMDNILEYKLPPPEYFRDMRGTLRNLHDRLDEHRRLIDKYSGIEMNTATSSVEDRIESKYQQLASRMPELPRYRSHGPALDTSENVTRLYYQSRPTTLGYGPGLMRPEGSHTSELRGRIRRLLCRARRDPHYYRFLPAAD